MEQETPTRKIGIITLWLNWSLKEMSKNQYEKRVKRFREILNKNFRYSEEQQRGIDWAMEFTAVALDYANSRYGSVIEFDTLHREETDSPIDLQTAYRIISFQWFNLML